MDAEAPRVGVDVGIDQLLVHNVEPVVRRDLRAQARDARYRAVGRPGPGARRRRDVPCSKGQPARVGPAEHVPRRRPPEQRPRPAHPHRVDHGPAEAIGALVLPPEERAEGPAGSGHGEGEHREQRERVDGERLGPGFGPVGRDGEGVEGHRQHGGRGIPSSQASGHGRHRRTEGRRDGREPEDGPDDGHGPGEVLEPVDEERVDRAGRRADDGLPHRHGGERNRFEQEVHHAVGQQGHPRTQQAGRGTGRSGRMPARGRRRGHVFLLVLRGGHVPRIGHGTRKLRSRGPSCQPRRWGGKIGRSAWQTTAATNDETAGRDSTSGEEEPGARAPTGVGGSGPASCSPWASCSWCTCSGGFRAREAGRSPSPRSRTWSASTRSRTSRCPTPRSQGTSRAVAGPSSRSGLPATTAARWSGCSSAAISPTPANTRTGSPASWSSCCPRSSSLASSGGS